MLCDYMNTCIFFRTFSTHLKNHVIYDQFEGNNCDKIIMSLPKVSKQLQDIV